MPLEIIEVQSGAYLVKDDIVRFDDAYGRKYQSVGIDASATQLRPTGKLAQVVRCAEDKTESFRRP